MTNEAFVDMLTRAIDGDSEAMSLILREYDPLFRRLSTIESGFDEDCYQYIRLRAFEMTRRFKMPEKNIFLELRENEE